jgi:hypothetical protein
MRDDFESTRVEMQYILLVLLIRHCHNSVQILETQPSLDVAECKPDCFRALERGQQLAIKSLIKYVFLSNYDMTYTVCSSTNSMGPRHLLLDRSFQFASHVDDDRTDVQHIYDVQAILRIIFLVPTHHYMVYNLPSNSPNSH